MIEVMSSSATIDDAVSAANQELLDYETLNQELIQARLANATEEEREVGDAPML